MYVDGGNLTAELTIDGSLDFVAAGLLIGGAVGFTSGRRTGCSVLIAGNAITLGAIYWLLRTSGNTGAVVWILLFSALAVVGLALAFSAPINSPRPSTRG